MQEDVLFWQTRIQIIQTPELFIPQPIPETAVLFYQRHEDIISFLYNVHIPLENVSPEDLRNFRNTFELLFGIIEFSLTLI